MRRKKEIADVGQDISGTVDDSVGTKQPLCPDFGSDICGGSNWLM